MVKWCIDEGKSGALLPEDRPGLTEALAWLHTGQADAIIARDLDRIAREVTTQEAVLAEIWRRAKSRAYTVTGEVPEDDPDDPMRTAMRQMAGVFSGLERRMIAKRLRDGRKAKSDAGGHAVGAYPYGYTRGDDGSAVPHPQEYQGLRLILEARQ